MAGRTPRTTDKRAAAVADRYIAPKGGKAKPAEKDPEDYELSEASIRKARSSPPPEIRVVETRAPAKAFTAREAAFVDEYLVDLNATQAAIRAGYSKRSAAEIGYENLRKPHIIAAIERAKRERAERTKVTVDTVLQGLVADYYADINDIFDAKGAVRPIDEWPLPFRRGLVSGMDVEEIWAGTGEERVRIGTMLKPRFADRTALKKLLGDHISLQAFNSRRTLDVEEGSALAQLMSEIGGKSFRPRIEASAEPGRPTHFRPREE